MRTGILTRPMSWRPREVSQTSKTMLQGLGDLSENVREVAEKSRTLSKKTETCRALSQSSRRPRTQSERSLGTSRDCPRGRPGIWPQFKRSPRPLGHCDPLTSQTVSKGSPKRLERRQMRFRTFTLSNNAMPHRPKGS